MWGPEYTYFDLPVVTVGGVRRNVLNRWTVISSAVAIVLAGAIYGGAIAQPDPPKDRIAWGTTVDPTLWEPSDQSARDVTMSLMDNRSSKPKVQARGSTTPPPSAKIPAGQVVVVAARYSASGHEAADDHGVFNDQCKIQSGGSVYLIGQYHDQVLVGYDPPVRTPSVEGLCTRKDVFYLELAT